jgi:hypothetical protein
MPRVRVPGAPPDGGDAGGDGAVPLVLGPGCDNADGGEATNCLSTAQTNAIRDWINAGAPSN